MNNKKYYLLVFCEDYGDEHNVPAISCMTEEEYHEWLETPSGEMNPKYEEQLLNYNNYQNARKILDDKIQNTLGINWRSTPFDKWPEDLLNENNNLHQSFGFKSRYPSFPKKCSSNLNAWLGNGGDCFEESYEHLYLMKEFVENNIVEVTEVNEDFYDIFNKAKLSKINLCNVFEIEE